MHKTCFFAVLFLILCCKVFATQDLTGFWQTYDKQTRLPRAVIAVYPYQGKYYGKIVATCEKGMIHETLYCPETRAPGVQGNPYYCGLDIIWGAVPDGKGRYKGYVMDPRNGNVYNAVLWKEGNQLILRGEVFVFGKNEILGAFPPHCFNTQFSEPDLSTFVPAIYKSR